jgi:hypothetical protein
MNRKPPEVLILRAWLEATAHPRLRIRIVALRPGQPERHVLTSTSVNTACDAVRDWLTSLEARNPDERGDTGVQCWRRRPPK